MEYLPGDHVSCRILDGEIVGNKAKGYDREESFLIVALDFDGNYILYIPDNLYVRDTFSVRSDNAKKMNIPNRYIDSQCASIGDRHVVKLHYRSDGVSCNKCGEHYQYAEANDGDKYFCYLCRENPYR